MKSYADEELKFCFLLPVEDSDEEEVKAKLVKCEACQMTLKECEMKKHGEKELRKLPAGGKIAYLIKPILKVLQDSGGHQEWTQIY